MSMLRHALTPFYYTEKHKAFDELRFRAEMYGANAAGLRSGEGRERFILWLREVLFIALAGLRSVDGLGNTTASNVEVGIAKHLSDFALMHLAKWSSVDAGEYIMETSGATLPDEVLANAKRGSFRERATNSRYFAKL